MLLGIGYIAAARVATYELCVFLAAGRSANTLARGGTQGCDQLRWHDGGLVRSHPTNSNTGFQNYDY